VFCSVLQCVAVCCSVLQCVAVCCSVLQHVAVYVYVYIYIASDLIFEIIDSTVPSKTRESADSRLFFY